MTTLFDPITLGDLELPNRIIMAPLTRCRADEGRVPNALMAEYYVQRASAGLILSEATSVTPLGVGYPDTPGIWSNDQPKGHVSLVRPITEFVTPRALETEEIADIIEAYRVGAENAKAAGFDGVELHAANGYLIDQFLQSSTNQRTDEYGANLTEKFTYVARELGKRGIAFICARERVAEDSIGPLLKEAFGGPYIANERFDKASANAAIANGTADAVAFGEIGRA
uniref:Oxidored_FMN domain-containing protein n=1 Tax=Steinernema glaseri TaxID=37863 RepID=A0A1I7ZLD1_9BILA